MVASVGRWTRRLPALVEVGLIAVAAGALSSPNVVMYVFGDRITGPVVDVRVSGENPWVTIEDPDTSLHYETRISRFSPAEEFATVIVHPTNRSRVLGVSDVWSGALVAVGVAMLPLAWPTVLWARRQRRIRPLTSEPSLPCQWLSGLSLWTAVVLLNIPEAAPSPDVFFGSIAVAMVPATLAVNALALHRDCRPDGYWGAAIVALGVTFGGLGLRIVATVAQA